MIGDTNNRQAKFCGIRSSFRAVADQKKTFLVSQALSKKNNFTEREDVVYDAKCLLHRSPHPSSCSLLNECFGEKSSRPSKNPSAYSNHKLWRRFKAC